LFSKVSYTIETLFDFRKKVTLISF